MTQIESGLAIVAALLDSAVDEWASSSTHDDDDWSYVDAVKAERDFANSIIKRLPDDTEKIKEMIVTILVRSARDTFESLVSGWDDDQLKGVPAITDGLAAATKWLEGKE